MSDFYPTENTLSILQSRYFQKNENWEGLCRRVAKELSQAEPEENRIEREEEFYNFLVEAKGLLNTPALVNLGTSNTGSVAACFSFRPEDSMDSILEIGRLAALTLKFGGGAGFELSQIRPEGFPVNSTHKYAMGPIGVMKFYNSIGEMVTQAGIRKAALIAILRTDHPDIIKFCQAKENDGTLANFNISVSIPDIFMKKLTSAPDKPHTCWFNNRQYHILCDGNSIPRADRGSKKVLSVKEVYDRICWSASKNGDPGILFVDHVNRHNPLLESFNDVDNPHYEAGTNPCGELPLPDRGACVLGSVDLAKFVVDQKVDFSSLSKAFRLMTRMLDDATSISEWPDPSIKEKVLQTRKIGVGIMGFASMLDKINIRYGSEECIKLINFIASNRESACLEESILLAKERGVYPAASEGSEACRNISRTTCPPTGTLAIIANTSWSLEPHLYWAFEERRNDEVKIRFLPTVEKHIDREVLEELVDTANSDLSYLNDLIQTKLPDHMVLAKDVTPEQHIEVVAAWQRYTDNAVSKTICAPSEILTPEKVGDIFAIAWEKKLKGLTVYPEGSREGEPMSIRKKKREKIEEIPKQLKSDRFEFEVLLKDKMRKTFCFVGLHPNDETRPLEIFLKHPYVQDPMAIQFIDLTTRLLSLILRYRQCYNCSEEAIPLGKVIKNLRETDGQSMFSVPSIFVKALGKYLSNEETVGKCPTPNCNGEIILVEGCESCLSCNFRSCL
jgi:ribonucleoside-diphosphate reductase alpha chain